MQQPHPAALLAFAIVLLGGVFIGEVFPFSNYPMYSTLGGGSENTGAVPVFFANGEIADVRDYDRFEGLEPDALVAPAPCSLEYKVVEMAHRVRDHAGAGCETPVSLGWVVVTWGADGLVKERVIDTEGTACRVGEGR